MQIEVPQGKSFINLPNGTKVQIPQGASKVNIPDNMFGNQHIQHQVQTFNNPNSANSYINGATPAPQAPVTYQNYTSAPQAPQMNNRVEHKSNWRDVLKGVVDGGQNVWNQNVMPIVQAGADNIDNIFHTRAITNNGIEAGKDIWHQNIEPVLQAGADNANAILGTKPAVDSIHKGIDYENKIAQIENINSRYKDLYNMAAGGLGNEKALQEYKQKRADTDQKIYGMLYGLGVDKVLVNPQGKIKVVVNGKEREIDDSFWKTLKDGVKASRSEMLADTAGGILGGTVGNILNKDPRKKVLATTLGMLAGAGTAVMSGREIDMLRNAIETRSKLTKHDIQDAKYDASAGSIYGGAAGGATAKILGDVVKGTGNQIIKGAKVLGKKGFETADTFSRLNAEKHLKDYGINGEQVHNERGAFEQTPQITGTEAEKTQDELASGAMSNSGVWNDVAQEVAGDPQASTAVAHSTTDRADSLYNQAKQGAYSSKEVGQSIKNHEADVKKTYSTMIDDLNTILPDYKVNIVDDIKSIVGEAVGGVANVEAKSHFRNLINRLGNKTSLGIKDLYDVRKDINRIWSSTDNRIDRDTIRQVVNVIDNRIKDGIDTIPEKDLAETLKAGFEENKARYSKLFDMQDSKVYKAATGEGVDAEKRSKELYKYAKDDEASFNNIADNLPEKDRAGMEMFTLVNILKRNTTKSLDGKFKAVNYKELIDQINAINPNSLKSENARILVKTIKEADKIFSTDSIMLHTAMGGKTKGIPQSIATSFEGKAKMARTNAAWSLFTSLIPTVGGKSMAFKRQVLQSLKKARSPRDAIIKLEKFTDTDTTLWKKAKDSIKKYEQVVEQEQAKKAQQVEADRIAKEAKDKARNAELIAKRDAEIQKRLDEEKKPIGSTLQSRKVDEAKEPSVGGSEEEAKEAVKQLFKKNNDKQFHLTKADEAELQRIADEEVPYLPDEENPFSDKYRGGYIANPILDNILAGGAGAAAPIDTNGDGKITAKDRGINALIAMGLVNARSFAKYAGKDMAKSTKAPSGMRKGIVTDKTALKNLKVIEDNIKKDPVETLVITDKKGNILDKIGGTANKVEVSKAKQETIRNYEAEKILTHNHPSAAAFSWNDLTFALDKGIDEIRAIGHTKKGGDFLYELSGLNKLPNNAEFRRTIHEKWRKIYDSKMPYFEPKALANNQAKINEVHQAHTHYAMTELSDQLGLEYKRTRIKNNGVSMSETPRTKKLLEWHKDSSPLTKNEDGTPKVFYHGTSSDFKEFSYDFVGKGADQNGAGFYFTDSPKGADVYSGDVGKEAGGTYGFKTGKEAKPNIMPVYLKIKKPLVLLPDGYGFKQPEKITKEQIKKMIKSAPEYKEALGDWGDIEYEGLSKVLDRATDAYYKIGDLQTINTLGNDFYNGKEKELLQSIEKNIGYDGTIIPQANGDTHYVIFNPNQIKSIHNQGTFNPNISNILKGLGLGALGVSATQHKEKPSTKKTLKKLGL